MCRQFAVHLCIQGAFLEVNAIMDDKEKNTEQKTNDQVTKDEEKIRDMKQELEDYIEEQGIYIRQ